MTQDRTRHSGRRVRTILEEIRPEFVISGAKTISHEDVEAVVDHSEQVLAAFAGPGALAGSGRGPPWAGQCSSRSTSFPTCCR